MIRAISRKIGGSKLAERAMAGALPEWYASRPVGQAGWSAAADAVANEFAGRSWLTDLLPAFQPSGPAADRLTAASQRGGIVVTGGQQPGLFGGPLYVLHKAITLLELANALSAATKRPVAPVFWAATDDADFVEASHVSVVRRGRLDALSMAEPAAAGRSMAMTPLGDIAEQIARLEEACGSAPASDVLDAVRSAYAGAATVGSAYVTLLRSLLEPLGIAVLDASHESVRAAGFATMDRALRCADGIANALAARSRAITAAGFHAQVADVPNLSRVFETAADGTRRRVPLSGATAVAENTAYQQLGPNVLLRPVMERQLLPTVCYVGGPGEVAYFAQVSAVANALNVALPRIVPRWSGTLMEPHVDAVLHRLGATIQSFADPHAVEGKVARGGVSPGIRSAIAELRAALETGTARMRADAQTSDALGRSIGTMRAGVEHRLSRLERRYAAAVKQGGSDDLRDVAMVRATLYPDGAPQERALSYVPFLARYGDAVLHATREEAGKHVVGVINGD